eukprot:2369143-Prymnesium_polylepis.2
MRSNGQATLRAWRGVRRAPLWTAGLRCERAFRRSTRRRRLFWGARAESGRRAVIACPLAGRLYYVECPCGGGRNSAETNKCSAATGPCVTRCYGPHDGPRPPARPRAFAAARLQAERRHARAVASHARRSADLVAVGATVFMPAGRVGARSGEGTPTTRRGRALAGQGLAAS